MKNVNLSFIGGLAFVFMLGLLLSFILFNEKEDNKEGGVTSLGSFAVADLHSGNLIRSRELEFPALFNVWASWCVSCRYEHGLLMELANQGVAIYGINYLDERQDALEWLELRGDPYVASLYDAKGSLGVELGIYGVPETFLIAENGDILVHHLGILTQEIWETKFLPLWQNI